MCSQFLRKSLEKTMQQSQKTPSRHEICLFMQWEGETQKIMSCWWRTDKDCGCVKITVSWCWQLDIRSESHMKLRWTYSQVWICFFLFLERKKHALTSVQFKDYDDESYFCLLSFSIGISATRVDNSIVRLIATKFSNWNRNSHWGSMISCDAFKQK